MYEHFKYSIYLVTYNLQLKPLAILRDNSILLTRSLDYCMLTHGPTMSSRNGCPAPRLLHSKEWQCKHTHKS